MAIACFISGRSRGIEESFNKGLINIINDLGIHVFASVNDDASALGFHKKYIERSIGREASVQCSKFSLRDHIPNLNLDRLTYHDSRFTKEDGANRFFSMVWNHKNNMNAVLESKIPFRIVVYIRPDITSIDAAVLKDAIKTTLYEDRDDTVWIPLGEDHTGINDRLAIGNVSAMTKYCSTFDTLVGELKNDRTVNNHPETALMKSIQAVGLKVVRFRMNTSLWPGRADHACVAP